MSVPAWDVGLPQKLLINGYNETAANNLLRTSMDVGPAKQRRRSTAGPRPVTGKLVMTSTQLGTFKAFYITTLLGGSLRFSWTDPVTSAAVEMRFTEAPSWTAVGRSLYDVELKLEILP